MAAAVVEREEAQGMDENKDRMNLEGGSGERGEGIVLL